MTKKQVKIINNLKDKIESDKNLLSLINEAYLQGYHDGHSDGYQSAHLHSFQIGYDEGLNDGLYGYKEIDNDE